MTGPQRPTPIRPPDEAIIWLDFHTGQGLDPAGQAVSPIIGGRRKKPNLVDLLDTARFARATRLMLCGDVQTGYQWLLPTETQITRNIDATPGWTDVGHYLGDPPRGRFMHTETQHRITVTTTAEWFGDMVLSPIEAEFAYKTLTRVVAHSIKKPDWGLMRSPSATGLNIWKQRFDGLRTGFLMEPIDPDIGLLIQATEPQHRFEHYVNGPGLCSCGDCVALVKGDTDMPGFAYADGRFMYHGVARGLRGSAPATMLTAGQAQELFTRDPYHPSRYKIRYTVSDYWDHIGFFPIKLDGAGRGWHWPNRPGFTGEAWANNIELRNATTESDWKIEILEGIAFTKGSNVIEPFATVTGSMLTMLDTGLERGAIGAGAHAAASSAIKHMFRVTIGSFSRRSRNTTRFAPTFEQVAPNAVGRVQPAANGGFVYQVPSNPRPDDAETWHPEIAALLWGAARTRVLRDARPTKTKALFGALQIEPAQLIGIQGDAIYTTEIQPWTLPEASGGADDGANGRIRLKGYLPGPITPPPTIDVRQELSNQAEEAGWEA